MNQTKMLVLLCLFLILGVTSGTSVDKFTSLEESQEAFYRKEGIFTKLNDYHIKDKEIEMIEVIVKKHFIDRLKSIYAITNRNRNGK